MKHETVTPRTQMKAPKLARPSMCALHHAYRKYGTGLGLPRSVIAP